MPKLQLRDGQRRPLRIQWGLSQRACPSKRDCGLLTYKAEKPLFLCRLSEPYKGKQSRSRVDECLDIDHQHSVSNKIKDFALGNLISQICVLEDSFRMRVDDHASRLHALSATAARGLAVPRRNQRRNGHTTSSQLQYYTQIRHTNY